MLQSKHFNTNNKLNKKQKKEFINFSKKEYKNGIQ